MFTFLLCVLFIKSVFGVPLNALQVQSSNSTRSSLCFRSFEDTKLTNKTCKNVLRSFTNLPSETDCEVKCNEECGCIGYNVNKQICTDLESKCPNVWKSLTCHLCSSGGVKEESPSCTKFEACSHTSNDFYGELYSLTWSSKARCNGVNSMEITNLGISNKDNCRRACEGVRYRSGIHGHHAFPQYGGGCCQYTDSQAGRKCEFYPSGMITFGDFYYYSKALMFEFSNNAKCQGGNSQIVGASSNLNNETCLHACRSASTSPGCCQYENSMAGKKCLYYPGGGVVEKSPNNQYIKAMPV